MVARGSVYCWDNATRGLDASTALEFAQAIRIMTNLLQSTALVTIYQASENIYQTFDNVTLLYAGRQIYYGPVEEAELYFERIGYEHPPRQSTPEFLTALTDPNGFHKIKPGFENKVPRTAEEFETLWKESPELAKLKDDIKTYNDRSSPDISKTTLKTSINQEQSKYTRKNSYYTISYWKQLQLCTQRGFQRIYGNKSSTIINIIAAVAIAFIIGSLGYNTPSSTDGAFTRGGVLYFSLLYYSLMGLANMTFDYRPILQKHKNYSLYHPSAESLGNTIAAFPFRMIGLTLFFIILYFLGLHRSAGSFFTVFLFLGMCSEAINGLFELVAAACDNISQANSIAGVLTLSISMYSTYMIQLPSMHPWFVWIAYILPIRYAFESMLNAEFHGRRMNCGGSGIIPFGPGYENVQPNERVCASVGSRPSQSYVLGDDYLKAQFDYDYKHTWRNFGILWCFIIGFIVLMAVVTEYKRPMKGGGDALIYKKGAKNFARKVTPDEEIADEMNEPDIESFLNGGKTEPSVDDSDTFEDLSSTSMFIWRNVCYTIKYKGGERQLLDNVSGYCKPGTLTALMGESGAGKTTLLNTLAQRNVGIITGDMLVDGCPFDKSFERRTGYVQQQDLHVAEMSVRESLIFSARMRRPQYISDKEKVAFA